MMLLVKSNKILYIGIFIILIFNVYLLCKVSGEEENYNNAMNFATTKDNLLGLYKINFDAGLNNNGSILDSLQTLLNISTKEEQRIIDVFQDRTRLLVCRFSELNCQECAIYSIVKMINYSDVIGKDNIMFWGYNENSRNLSIMKERIGIDDMEVFNCIPFDIPIEELCQPYYFIIDSSLVMSDVFIPDKSFPEHTNHYIEMIRIKYFE